MTSDSASTRESPDVDSVRQGSLRILGQAIALGDIDARMEELLADFDTGFAKGWRMAVGTWFWDALDIKQTQKVVGQKKISVWTQGGAFAFAQGDTFYDTPQAYQQWDIALESIAMAYQVLQATPSRPRKEIIWLRRNKSFSGSLIGSSKKPNTARRKEVFEHTPSDWAKPEDIMNRVKKATGKSPGAELLQKLCDLGALERKVDVKPRFPGTIRFQVMVPNADRRKLEFKEQVAMTQDDFVALLITGEGISS